MAAVLPDVIDEDILVCALCLRQTRGGGSGSGPPPKVLPCLHLFCAQCLEDYAIRYDSQRDDGYLTFPDSAKAFENNSKRFEFPSTSSNQTDTNLSDVDNQNIQDTTTKNKNRRSGGNDGKRFQHPERYTNRDALQYHANVYREKYRQSQASPENQATKHRPDTLPLRSNAASLKKKHLARAVSSPQRFYDPENNESPTASSLSGRVSNIINLYEQKTEETLRGQTPPRDVSRRSSRDLLSPVRSPTLQHSISQPARITLTSERRENTPPLASFRTKSQEERTKLQPFIPLNQRPLPEPRLEPPDITALRTISEDSYDSAIGTADSDKQIMFVDAPKLISPASSMVEDEHLYESFEVLNARSRSLFPNKQERGISPDVTKSTGHLQPERPTAALLRKKQALPSRRSIASIRPESHIYDEINTPLTKKKHGSVPDLLAEVPKNEMERTSSVVLRKHRRRNSTDLDSYVMASDSSSDLGHHIPLSSEDSQRLSNMYMRMDGCSHPLISQMSYVPMDSLRSPTTPGSPNVFIAESIDSLIRSISHDFKRRESLIQMDLKEVNFEREKKNPEILKKEPEQPIYANAKELAITEPKEKQEVEVELDMPIPVYESTKYSSKQLPQGYHNKPETKEAEQEDTKPNTPRNELYLPCPTCQRPFLLPNRQVAALQDCSFASQLQEVVETQKCERKLCGHCETKSASYKCLDCELYLCTGCHQGHSWQRSNKGHRVVTLQELQSGKYQKEIKQLQVSRCDRCREAGARHFCAQCDQLMCSDCLVDHSSTHQSCPLEEVACRQQDYIQSMAHTLQSRKDIFHGALNNLSNYQRHCQDSQAAILDCMKSQQEYLHAVLDRSFDFLKSKVTTEHNKEISKAESLKTAAQRNLASMDYVLKFVHQVVQHGNPGNVVSMAKPVKQEIGRLQSMTPKVMDSQMTMTYAPTDVMIEQFQPFCGNVKTNFEALPEHKRGSNLGNDLDLTKHHTHQMSLLHQFTTKLERDGKGCRPNGIALSPTEDILVVVDDINKKLKAFDFIGNFLWEIGPDGVHRLKDPWDVTFLSNGNLAVTDKGANDIKIFTKYGGHVVSFGAHLKKPWGITTNSKGEVLVTDTVLRKVFVHDEEGRLKYTVPNQSSASLGMDCFTLKCPEYICSNLFDDVIISDFENHRILAFDSLGRHLFKFGKKGKGMEEFHYPLGVATDANGNIFVVNYQNQRVTVVNRNGQFLCCLTADTSLQALQTLCVNREGHLVVIDGSWVKVFKLPQGIMGQPQQNNERAGNFVRLGSQSRPGDRLSQGRETSV